MTRWRDVICLTGCILAALAGCDGLGDGSGGGNGQTQIQIDSLSANSALPLSLLTITGSGFDPAADLFVRFVDEQGFTVDVPVLDATSRSVTVSAPPVIDLTTGELSLGTVSVQVVQKSGEDTVA